VNIQNVLECRHTSAPVVNGIVNNALFHSGPISIRRCLRSFTSCCTFIRQIRCWIMSQIL